MRTTVLLSLLLAACVWAFSCGSSSSNCTADCGTTTDAGISFDGLPSVHGACATPAFTTGGFMNFDGGGALAGVVLAWGGKEGAVASYDGASVKLQRFAQDATLIGQPIVVGTAGSYEIQLGVATDGNVYVTCWTGPTPAMYGVQCSSTSIATGVVTPGFATTDIATGGAVAYGPAGFVVVYGTNTVIAQPLNADASPRGDPSSIAPFVAQQPYIVGTNDGYFVGLIGKVVVVRLDAALQPLGSTTFSTTARVYGLAASGATIGVDWSEGDGTMTGGVSSVDDASTTFAIGTDASCPATPGFLASAAGGVDSFAFTWAMSGSSLGYRAFDTKGNALGAATSFPTSIGGLCPYPAESSVAVGYGFVVAVASAVGLQLFHLGCP
jgi:hypothetical protein